MTETPNQVHGRLLEGVHVAGYTFERAFDHLEWLLDGDRWREVGAGYENVNSFLTGIRLDEFRVVAEQRKRVANRIKELQPEAQNTKIAKMLGVHESTIREDTSGNPEPARRNAKQNNKPEVDGSGFPEPAAVTGPEAAQAAAGLAAKRERKARKEAAKQQVASAVFSDDGPFGTVVIDPPWEVEKIDREVRPNQAEFDYPTMSEEELRAFWFDEMARRTEPDCHLFMWTTQKYLPLALKLIGDFGFRYVLTFVWHKAGGFQPHDLPQFNCEFAIYGRRGAPVFVDTKAFPCCFEAPRREHSRKPDFFYDMIRRVTGGSRIDVFSREAREGFAQYGNDCKRFTEAAE